jgi:hypothetical protein
LSAIPGNPEELDADELEVDELGKVVVPETTGLAVVIPVVMSLSLDPDVHAAA